MNLSPVNACSLSSLFFFFPCRLLLLSHLLLHQTEVRLGPVSAQPRLPGEHHARAQAAPVYAPGPTHVRLHAVQRQVGVAIVYLSAVAEGAPKRPIALPAQHHLCVFLLPVLHYPVPPDVREAQEAPLQPPPLSLPRSAFLGRVMGAPGIIIILAVHPHQCTTTLLRRWFGSVSEHDFLSSPRSLPPPPTSFCVCVCVCGWKYFGSSATAAAAPLIYIRSVHSTAPCFRTN